MKITTKSGFNCEVDPEVLNDYEFLELAVTAMNGNKVQQSAATFQMIRGLLGEVQEQALKEHLREENGRVPFDKMGAELLEILAGMRQDETVKNS